MPKKKTKRSSSKKTDQEIIGLEVDPLLTIDELSKTPDELETYIHDIRETVRGSLDQSIAILTPWFFKNMPQIYYQTVPRVEKVRHLSSILTGHIFETRQTIELWNRERTEVTYLGPGGDKTLLVDLARKLDQMDPKFGAFYYSHDKLLFIANFFTNGFQTADAENKHILSKINRAKKLLLQAYPKFEKDIEEYIQNLDHNFVMYSTARRIRNTFRMYKKMLLKEGAQTLFEPWDDEHRSGRLTIGMKEVKVSEVLEDIHHLIHRYGFEINRYFITDFREKLQEPITLINFNLIAQDHQKIDFDSVRVKKMIKALRTLAWVDTDEYSEFVREPDLYSVNAANLARATATWVHILLSKENPYYFSEHRVLTTFLQNKELVREYVEVFRMKFNPLQEEDRKKGIFEKRREAFAESIEKVVDLIERRIFKEALKFLDHVLLTNYYFDTKTGLAFRLSPDVLDISHYPQKPFAIYFILGRDYRFFHIRWKDIARGGLRVVMPRNATEYSYALSRLFDEVYGLSYAQQMKNKDIPEGGSKGVMILKLNTNRDRAVKGAVNALLDLLVKKEETRESDEPYTMFGYYQEEEIIYLGPDENMTKELITWITRQAERRGYRYAKAFMSSKPGAGINHKEYGVTSEGVHVYVHEVLEFLGIDPKKETFTVKMTGGPDGDVAGNELKILYREYGENARVTAIADGFGAAYDPKGLNWIETLRLVAAEKSIAEFDPKKLSKSKEAFVVKADTNENTLKRNNLHFEAPTDIFIPAGGRPYSVTEASAEKFLDAEGNLTCRAVVEGANIYFTNEARERLQSLGVIMIKDSTANKTGVICSSFEVLAASVLDEKEFMELKEVYVSQVVDILREKAANEARLLFKEYSLHQERKNLVTISQEISKEINYLTDMLLVEFTKNAGAMIKDPLYVKLIYKHSPPVLVEKYKKRLLEELPLSYMVSILAAQIASYIIYSEGLEWIESIRSKDIVRAATSYMQNVEDTEKLLQAIDASKLKEKKEIRTILEKSAARVLTMIDLEKENSVKVL